MVSLRFLWWILFASTALAANPVPILYEPLSPTSTAPGSAGLTLTVHGTGFVSGSVVQWDGKNKTTHFISNSELATRIAASDLISAHTASVTVLNPAPGGGVSNSVYFQISNPSSSVSFTASGISCPSSGCYSVSTADFNHDGILDMAVTEIPTFGQNPSLEIFLGNGDGSFRPGDSYYAGISPSAGVVGDFNHDGNLDLAIVSQISGVFVLLGNGDGTFQPAIQYGTGQEPFAAVTGDFNQDGKLDLAVVNKGSNNVVILLGNGDGTFQPAVPFRTLSSPVGLTSGDFNGDGVLDLAITSNTTTGGISILLGNGDGTFQKFHVITTQNFLSITTADFNHDGRLDLAAGFVGLTASGVEILLGNGNGSFRSPVTYSAGETPWAMALGDFNADGKIDLAVADGSWPPGGPYLMLGNGDGTFQTSINFPLDHLSNSIVAGDFNQDGKLDLATGDTCTSSCLVNTLQQ